MFPEMDTFLSILERKHFPFCDEKLNVIIQPHLLTLKKD